ncbi:MAG: calcium-binding protein, partial [Sedimenticola sp.]
ADDEITTPIDLFEFADGSSNSFDELLIKTKVTIGEKKQRSIITGREDDIIVAESGTTTVEAGSGNDFVYLHGAGGKNHDDKHDDRDDDKDHDDKHDDKDDDKDHDDKHDDRDDDKDHDHNKKGPVSVFGEGGDDYLHGGEGDDLLDGGCGTDTLIGENGKDVLTDTLGNNAFFGGAHDDLIEAGDGDDFIAGGRHNDIIQAGGGNNVIAYNKGDGKDTILPGEGAQNVLSLGDDIEAKDLSFSRKGENLILNVKKSNSITFQDWYADAANHNFVTLQIIDEEHNHHSKHDDDEHEDHKSKKDDHDQHKSHGKESDHDDGVEHYDFLTLVDQFDSAKAAKPRLSKWSLMNGLLDAHLDSGEDAAFGGEFATNYAEDGSPDMSWKEVRHMLKDLESDLPGYKV